MDRGKSGELILLGTGTGVPSLKRSSSACLLKYGGKNILIDSGPGTVKHLLEIGITYNDVDLILITHTHPDHTSDLIPLFFAARYFSRPRKKDLSIIGGEGLNHFLEKLNESFEGVLFSEEYMLMVKEVVSDTWEWEGIHIKSIPVKHKENSLGFRFMTPHFNLAYSGDADYSEELVHLAEGVDIFVCECAMPDDFKIEGHLTPMLAARVAEEAKVKTLILTHFYPEVEKEPIREIVKKYFYGEVILGRDMMRFDL